MTIKRKIELRRKRYRDAEIAFWTDPESLQSFTRALVRATRRLQELAANMQKIGPAMEIVVNNFYTTLSKATPPTPRR